MAMIHQVSVHGSKAKLFGLCTMRTASLHQHRQPVLVENVSTLTDFLDSSKFPYVRGMVIVYLLVNHGVRGSRHELCGAYFSLLHLHRVL